MTKNQMIANMKKVLDWNARIYKKSECETEKEQLKSEFRIEVTALNMLLRETFKRSTGEDLFIARIETYITIRECENWE